MARTPHGTIPTADAGMFDKSDTLSVTIPVTDELVDWWDRHLLRPHGLTPQAVADILLRDLHRDETVILYRFDGKDGQRVVQLAIEGREGTHSVYLAGHSLYLTRVEDRKVPARHVEIDVLDVVPSHQGRGISASIMRNTYDLAVAVGIGVMTVEAYLTGGPYAWPSYGFVPLPEFWPTIRHKMTEKLEQLGDQVPVDVRRRVEPVLSASSPRAIFALLDERHPVESRGPDGVVRTVHLARALLADTDQRWYGVLDLDDPASRDLFFECIARNLR